jgi:hypothetical protein
LVETGKRKRIRKDDSRNILILQAILLNLVNSPIISS